jgi:hypothetical protein
MNTAWKWILGVLGVLIVVGLIAGAVFMWRTPAFHMGARVYQPWAFDGPASPDESGIPQGYENYRRYHMDGWGGRMPMMGYGYGYSPYAFSPWGSGLMLVAGLFRLLLPLGILALVAYVFYQMGRRAGLTEGSSSTPRRMPDVESLPRRKVARS